MFKNSKVTWVLLAVIIGLCIWIYVAEFSRPTVIDPRRTEAEQRVKVLTSRLDSAFKAGKEQRQKEYGRRVKDSVERKALKSKSEGWEKRYKELKPVIVIMADTSAILKEFLTVDDSLHAAKGEEIAKLEEVNRMQEKAYDDLVINCDAENRIHAQLMEEKDAIIAIQDKTIKKQGRVIKFLKVMLPTGVVVTLVVVLLMI